MLCIRCISFRIINIIQIITVCLNTILGPLTVIENSLCFPYFLVNFYFSDGSTTLILKVMKQTHGTIVFIQLLDLVL